MPSLNNSLTFVMLQHENQQTINGNCLTKGIFQKEKSSRFERCESKMYNKSQNGEEFVCSSLHLDIDF